MGTRKIESLFIVLIALWILEKLFMSLTPFWIHQVVQGQEAESRITFFRVLGSTLGLMMNMFKSIACGIWLQFEARKEKRSPWLWCLAGLAFQVPALIAFLATLILRNTQLPQIEPREE